MESRLPEHVRRNREAWDLKADEYVAHGESAWAQFWILCVPDTDNEGPATERLLRPYFGMYRFEWPDETGVEFHLGYGDWIRLLRANELEVTDLIEVQPPPGATTTFELTTPEWAHRWPCEEIWKARKVNR